MSAQGFGGAIRNLRLNAAIPPTGVLPAGQARPKAVASVRRWLVLLAAVLCMASIAVPAWAQNGSVFQQLAGLQVRMQDMVTSIQNLEFESFYCSPADKARARAALLDKLQQVNALRDEYNQFKNATQQASINQTAGVRAELANINLSSAKFWADSDAYVQQMYDAYAAKLSEFKNTPVKDCSPQTSATTGPPPPTAPPPPPPPPAKDPLSGLTRPPIPTANIPKAPDFFCTDADKAKFMDALKAEWDRLLKAMWAWSSYTGDVSDRLQEAYRARPLEDPTNQANLKKLQTEFNYARSAHDDIVKMVDAASAATWAAMDIPVVKCNDNGTYTPPPQPPPPPPERTPTYSGLGINPAPTTGVTPGGTSTGTGGGTPPPGGGTPPTPPPTPPPEVPPAGGTSLGGSFLPYRPFVFLEYNSMLWCQYSMFPPIAVPLGGAGAMPYSYTPGTGEWQAFGGTSWSTNATIGLRGSADAPADTSIGFQYQPQWGPSLRKLRFGSNSSFQANYGFDGNDRSIHDPSYHDFTITPGMMAASPTTSSLKLDFGVNPMMSELSGSAAPTQQFKVIPDGNLNRPLPWAGKKDWMTGIYADPIEGKTMPGSNSLTIPLPTQPDAAGNKWKTSLALDYRLDWKPNLGYESYIQNRPVPATPASPNNVPNISIGNNLYSSFSLPAGQGTLLPFTPGGIYDFNWCATKLPLAPGTDAHMKSNPRDALPGARLKLADLNGAAQ